MYAIAIDLGTIAKVQGLEFSSPKIWGVTQDICVSLHSNSFKINIFL
jgi:hypothetical protein